MNADNQAARPEEKILASIFWRSCGTDLVTRVLVSNGAADRKDERQTKLKLGEGGE